jgi:hypothetical protein
MPFQRKRHFRARHATAIVGNFNEIDPAGRQSDFDSAAARIDRVFDQFFERAGRTFHHFTSGDPIDEVLWQTAY